MGSTIEARDTSTSKVATNPTDNTLIVTQTTTEGSVLDTLELISCGDISCKGCEVCSDLEYAASMRDADE